MKQFWKIETIGPDPDRDCTKKLRTSHVQCSLQKTIGIAMLDIHHDMLGEYYTVRQSISTGSVILIAEGTRGGYPQQPKKLTVIITSEKEAASHEKR